MPSKLAEKREELATKHELVGRILKEARPDGGQDYEFDKVKCLGELDVPAKVEKLRELNKELADLTTECKKLELDEIAAAHMAVDTERKKIQTSVPQPQPGNGASAKSLGQRFVESELYRSFKSQGVQRDVPVTFDDISLKTLFETGAGWAPESTRISRVIDAVTRPIQVLDLIPMLDTQQASIVFMEETTRTHAAAERAEGATYPESTFLLTERSSPVRKIADSIPVTDEQLEDESQVRAYLDQRLQFGVRQRLDSQVLNGDGIAPNLTGILNTAGIQTRAMGTDPIFDAVHNAMTLIRVNGRAIPNAVVFHPFDWEGVRLARTTEGIYLFGHPSQPGPMTLFGVAVALGDVIAQGTALVGDFANWVALWDRRGIEVRVGFVNTQFVSGQQTLRADVRAALTVYRPPAFCTVTGITFT